VKFELILICSKNETMRFGLIEWKSL